MIAGSISAAPAKPVRLLSGIASDALAGDLFTLSLCSKSPFVIAAPAKPARLRGGVASDALGADRLKPQ
jgi:hypothetical protein